MGQLGTALQGSGDVITITGIVVAAFCPPAGGALIAAGGTMATTGDTAELRDDYNSGNLNGEKVVTKAAMFGIPHGFSALGATTREAAAIEGLLIGLDNTVDEYRDNDYK